MEIEFSDKQAEYIRCANKRWNLKAGATRSGKTTLDYIYTISERILSLRGKQGLIFFLGVSQGTVERNVLTPMREFWGKNLIGEINNKNICRVFGEKVYCLGAEKINAVATIRGSEAKYIYGDEIAEWNEELFELVKSRLSLPYSKFDGSCNPQDTTHFVYKFFYDNYDPTTMYVQNYEIFDNPFLAPAVVDALCNEYRGTVYYDRYILGKWVRAEGVIYRLVADNPKAYTLTEVPLLWFINVGVDFGGNKSQHSFTATGFTHGYKQVIVLESETIKTGITPTQLEERFVAFVNRIQNKYKVFVKGAYLDCAEQALIQGIRITSARKGLPVPIKNSLKNKINDRINLIIRLLGSGRLFWTENSTTSLNAYRTAVWDTKAKTDTRLDDGSVDVDSLDSTEYSIEPEMKNLLLTLGGN